MSLAEMQSCLARLYVSETYRLQFKHDPDRALAGYALAEDQAAVVRALDQKMLDFFAATLINKHERRVQRAYTSSYAWHEAAMHALFHRFHELQGARTQTTIHHETVAFGHFAEQTLSDPQRFAPASAELVRFERATYEATFVHHPEADQVDTELAPDDRLSIPDGVQIEEFDYDVVALNTALRQGVTDPEPERLPATIAFRPQRLRTEKRMCRLNSASATLVRHCDGQSTVAEVIDRVCEDLGVTDIDADIIEALQKLVTLHVLIIAPEHRR